MSNFVAQIQAAQQVILLLQAAEAQTWTGLFRGFVCDMMHVAVGNEP